MSRPTGPVIIFLIFSGLIIAFPWIIAQRKSFFGHSTLGGVALQNLSKEEAVQRFRPIIKHITATPILLSYHDESWLVTPKAIGAFIDYKSPLNRLWQIGRSGSPVKRWREILFPPRLNLPFSVIVKPNRFRAELFHLKPLIEKDPVNASFDIATGALIPEVWGRRVNFAATRPHLTAAIIGHNQRRASLIFQKVPPKTTTRQLRATRVQYLLSTYITYFDPDIHVRSANIRRGAQQISGVLLPPGKVFSFNGTTGPRSMANGYGEALEIVNKRLVPGVGGGICQVSSTLYNAVLLAGLPILERSSHSLPLGYVPLGRDATVYYGNLDLSFRNTTGGNILILTEAKEKQITVAILGETKPEERVEIKTEIVKRIPYTIEKTVDPTLPPKEQRIVQPGQKGYIVRSERLFYLPNGEVRKEQLSLDYYRPQSERISVGSGFHEKKSDEKPDVPWWKSIFEPGLSDSGQPHTSESPRQPKH
ncbi:MAG TPA: VanW family protein [Bacillota bacterium]|nr:VanW family protein [Bacillota bacterium]